jgi:hypothetical protein
MGNISGVEYKGTHVINFCFGLGRGIWVSYTQATGIKVRLFSTNKVMCTNYEDL